MAIPEPEQGLVINYTYLWHHEHTAGHEEGRKDRPSVIVLAVDRASDGATVVTVLPVTHTPPRDPASAIEIPAAIKRHLGLDDHRSWIVVEEGNPFVRPGYDLRHVPNRDRFDYGFLPPRFFTSVQTAFVAAKKTGKGRATPRT